MSRCRSTRRPTIDASSPPRPPATACRRPSSSWGPAPTRSSTSSRRPSCRSAARPWSRRRPTRCTASTPNSAAPRSSPSRDDATRTGPSTWRRPAQAARTADVVWLCSPNNPTAMPEPDGAIAGLLVGILADAVADGRTAPIVVIDEAYAEFTGRSLVGLRADYPNLIVIRTASKAYALAGLRVGFAIAHPVAHRPDEPVPAARQHLGRVRHARHRGPPRRHDPRGQPAPRRHRAGPARGRLARDRLVGRTIRHELHPRRLRLRTNGRRPSPRGCCATVSCHGPSRTVTRWPTTCA